MYFTDPLFAMQNSPPVPGSLITASIGYQGQSLYPAGTFQIDSYLLEGPPDIFIVKCNEAGITTPMRTLNSVAYEGKTLSQIAKQVAAKHGMTAITDAIQPDVQYDRMTQNQESDLSFLLRIANEHGYEFQVRNNQLIFYSRISLEQAPPSGTIDKLGSQVKRWRLENQTIGHRTHQASTIGYFDPNSKKVWTETQSDPNVVTSDHVKAVQRLENSQQAQVRAGAFLHEHNMLTLVGEIDLVGTMVYRARMTVNIKNFGVFDSIVWIVEKAEHLLNRQGYITRLHIRTTLKGNKLKGKQALTPTYFSAPINSAG
jgi:phage protein D